MRRTRTLRIVAVVILAVVLLVASIDLLISRSNDGDSGYVAVCFVSSERMFPQMDYQQLFSSEDIQTYFVVDDGLTKEEMLVHLDQALKPKSCTSAILLCEGEYATAGLQIASEDARVSDLILMSPKVKNQNEIAEIGSDRPAGRVALYSIKNVTADLIYERLSGEDTSFTRGTKADENAPELFLSADARRYYACMDDWAASAIAPERLLNSPVVQTYLANYLHNYVLEKEGVSRAPLGYWVVKMICTILAIVAFFLYAATFPKDKKISVSNASHTAGGPNADPGMGTEAGSMPAKGKPRGRMLSEKYQSALHHLMALQGFLGLLAALPACIFVIQRNAAYHTVLLVWVCISLLSSAFYLLRFLNKIKDRNVRKNRSMWPIHMGFTGLLLLDIFMLKLLWKGNGFLKLNLLLLVAILLAIMVWVAVTMLQLTDEVFGRNQGSKQSVIDSFIFSAIRFVPMVIVFVFSVIIGREIYAVRVILLMLALIGASYLRRVIRKGGRGELFSVILYACLYWMMF